jgi:peptide chain release factor 2
VTCQTFAFSLSFRHNGFVNKEEIQKEIERLEGEMMSQDFWADKDKAQATIKRIAELRDEFLGVGKYDKLGAVITIFAGVGGDDAEDFVSMLYKMYSKYCDGKSWHQNILNESENNNGGYRSITLEITKPHFAKASRGENPYGILKNESGVHRLVRISPFNAQGKRQTSFAMVEVVPLLEEADLVVLDEKDLKIEFAKSGGAGGQNVNKRETAVRIVHTPTNFSASCQSERSQEANREKAMNLLKAKLVKKQEEDAKKMADGLAISKTVEIEWGNQIRNYVLHPYKMVKDLRTNVETSDVDGVLSGDIEEFLKAEKGM